jgi:hypothetical protein
LYRTAIIISLLICCYVCLSGQLKPKTNLEIFDETISAELDKYFFYPGVNRNNLFIFVVNPVENGGSIGSTDDENRFLSGLIKKTASQNNLKFGFTKDPADIKTDSAYNLLVMQIIKLETRYTGFKKNRFLGEKSVIRNIFVNIAVELKTSDGRINTNDFVKNNSEDEVDYDNYKQLESSDYGFTQGTPPEVGAFERIIFPVLLICATAAATVLFFIIRSK